MRQVAKSADKSGGERVNAFGRWALDNRLKISDLAARLDKPRGQVWHWTLPLDDPDFVVPRGETLAAIFLLTAGAIEPNHFYGVEAWRRLLTPKAAA